MTAQIEYCNSIINCIHIFSICNFKIPSRIYLLRVKITTVYSVKCKGTNALLSTNLRNIKVENHSSPKLYKVIHFSCFPGHFQTLQTLHQLHTLLQSMCSDFPMNVTCNTFTKNYILTSTSDCKEVKLTRQTQLPLCCSRWFQHCNRLAINTVGLPSVATGNQRTHQAATNTNHKNPKRQNQNN